jgi:hypothetical protein
MKKLLVGIIVASILVSCVEDDPEIIKNDHEKTKIARPLTKDGGETKKESDSIRPILQPTKAYEPGSEIDPGTSLPPGEVGPVVITPPK